MKKRLGFVSNSSSASFVIAKEHLNKNQIIGIRKHIEVAKLLEWDVCSEDAWDIDEDEDSIRGNTFMDNFDIIPIFKFLGIDYHHIDYWHSNGWDNKTSWKYYFE